MKETVSKIVHQIRNLLQEIVGVVEIDKPELVLLKVREINKLLIELEHKLKLKCKRCSNPVEEGHSPFCKSCHVYVQDQLLRHGIAKYLAPVIDFRRKDEISRKPDRRSLGSRSTEDD